VKAGLGLGGDELESEAVKPEVDSDTTAPNWEKEVGGGEDGKSNCDSGS
jgi:hypothetical protein